MSPDGGGTPAGSIEKSLRKHFESIQDFIEAFWNVISWEEVNRRYMGSA